MTEQTTGSNIVEFDALEARLNELKDQYERVSFDVTTKDGMKAAKAARKDLREHRTSLEKKRKELKAPVLERSKLLDSEAKRITSIITDLETPIVEQIQHEEQRAEREKQEREAEQQERIDSWQAYVNSAHGADSETIADLLEQAQGIDDQAGFYELKKQAMDARANVVNTLSTMLENAKVREENEKLRAQLEQQQAASDNTVSQKVADDWQASMGGGMVRDAVETGWDEGDAAGEATIEYNPNSEAVDFAYNAGADSFTTGAPTCDPDARQRADTLSMTASGDNLDMLHALFGYDAVLELQCGDETMPLNITVTRA